MVGILLFSSVTSLASGHHEHELIQQTAVDYVRDLIPDNINIKSITANTIDRRLKFAKCSEPLEVSSTMRRKIARNWTIQVRCEGDTTWSLYVPVKAELTRQMITSTTTITRGELITADKIKLTGQRVSNSNQKHFTDAEHVLGREARRTIRPDRIIDSSMLQQAYLVRKKEAVMIYAQNSKLKISMQGTALKNGHYHEKIKVRNNSSRKIIEALVVDRGVVAVNF
jgi:flagella basal body P-ring formation protein FlgA